MQTTNITKADKAFLIIWGIIIVTHIVNLSFAAVHHGTLSWHGDTYTYYSAIESLQQGAPGLFRPPLYPIILFITESIAGKFWGGWIIMLLQTGTYLWSAFYLYRLSLLCTRRKAVAAGALLLYGAYPATIFYSIKALPESFVISLTVFMIWWSYKALRFSSPRAATFATLIMAALIALKPIFIYLIPFYICTWIWLSVRYRRFIHAIWICVACACLLGLYTQWMKHHYGAAVISYTSVVNDYYTVREAGALTSDSIADPELRRFVRQREDSCKNIFDHLWYAKPSQFDLGKLCDEINEAKLENPDKMAALWKCRVRRLADSSWYPLGTFFERNMCKYSVNRLYFVYIVLILAPFLFIPYRRLDYPMFMFTAMLWALTVSHIIVLILGAMFDWGRLMSPVFPAWILLLAMETGRVADIWASRMRKSVKPKVSNG